MSALVALCASYLSRARGEIAMAAPVGAKDVALVQETVEELRSRGEAERAHALQAVLAAATAAPTEPGPEQRREYLTTGQAASVLGVSRQTVTRWLASGRLSGTTAGRQRLVHRSAVE